MLSLQCQYIKYFLQIFSSLQLYCIMGLDIKNTKFSSPGRLSAVIEVNCIAVSQEVSTFLQKIEN